MDATVLKRAWEQRRNAIEAFKVADAEPESAERSAKLDKIEADIRSLDQRIAAGLDSLEQERRFIDALDSAPETRSGGDPLAEARAAEVDAFVKFAKGELRSVDFLPPTAELRALTKGVAAAGGNTVPTGMYDQIIKQMRDLSVVLEANATVINTASGETLLIPQSGNWSAATIVGEGSAISTSEPSFGQTSIGAFKYGFLAQAAPELLTDSAFDVEGYVAEQGGDALGQGMGAHFVTGTGTGQPQGIMTGATIGKTTAAIAAVTADELFDAYHSVLRPYRRDAVWLFNDSTVAALRKLKDTTNQYLWQPGLQLGQPDTLLGRPVLTDPAIAALGTGNLFGGFGDVKRAYLVRLTGGIRVERSSDYAFNTDLITYKFIARADGRVVDSSAFKTLKNA